MPSINTNLPAMTAQRNMAATQTLFHRTVTRLSSGLRINSAADDAAGLYLSEKLRNQVRGLQQASRNAQDGASLLQTAEGGLSVHNDILLRIRELAVQSANGIMTDGDRALMIASEVEALVEELTRVSNTTQFNGVKLLDGRMGGAQATGVGTAVGTQSARVDAQGNVVAAALVNGSFSGAQLISARGIDAIVATEATRDPKAYTLDITAYDNVTDSVTVTLEFLDSAAAAGDLTLAAAVVSSQAITINNVSAIKGSKVLNFDQFGINVYVNSAIGTDGGGVATAHNRADATNNQIGFAVSSNLALVDTDTTTANIQSTSILSEGLDGVVLQVGANNVSADQLTLLNMNAMTATGLGLIGTTTGTAYSISENVKTQSGAQLAIDIVDQAIQMVSTQRAKLGAYQNRLEYTVRNLGVAAENQAAANSRILDADVAAEVSELVRTQILSQSAMAILAQANAAPQALLSLFR